jgi:hypothetical protein
VELTGLGPRHSQDEGRRAPRRPGRAPVNAAATVAIMGRSAHSRSDDREFEMVLGSIEDLLREAVVETIATGSPESARDRVEELVDVDEGLGLVDSGPPPAQGTALLVLGNWLLQPVRQGAPADPEPLLDWIGSHLGARYRARARYMAGMLDPDDGHEAVALYAEALGDDFLPTLIWIAAALTVVHGDGDPAWLTKAAPPGS